MLYIYTFSVFAMKVSCMCNAACVKCPNTCICHIWCTGCRLHSAHNAYLLARGEDGGVGAGRLYLPCCSGTHGPAATGRFWRIGEPSNLQSTALLYIYKSDWLGMSSLASSCCCCKEGLCRTPASISALHTRHEQPMQQSIESHRTAQCMKCIDAHLSTCSTNELE